MIDENKKEKIRWLLDRKFFGSQEEQLDWLAERGFIKVHEGSFNVFYDNSDNYIGNDHDFTYDEIMNIILNKALEDKDYDSIIQEFNIENDEIVQKCNKLFANVLTPLYATTRYNVKETKRTATLRIYTPDRIEIENNVTDFEARTILHNFLESYKNFNKRRIESNGKIYSIFDFQFHCMIFSIMIEVREGGELE